jgi:hypothetical protein
MKRNHYHYARKWRQFRYLSKQVDRALTSGRFQRYSRTKQLQIQKRLQALYSELKGVFSFNKLRKALAGAAMILGLSAGAQAQTFELPVFNPFGIDHVGFFAMPTMVDLDNDGDLDMLAAEYAEYTNGFEFYYFENTGSADNPVFAAPQQNPFGIDDFFVSRPTFGDIDNDGDLDILAGNWGYDYYGGGSGTLRFYENTGTVDSPTFADPIEEIGGLAISSYYFTLVEWIDMDGDGDLDLYTTQDLYGEGVYYENIGTPEEADYGPAQSNPFGTTAPALGPRFFDFADIDNDGDQDLLTTVYDFNTYGSELFFQENLGSHVNPDFDEPTPMPFGGISAGGPNSGSIVQAFMADIDGDGDQDLFFNVYSEISAIYGDAVFYEQITTTAPVSDDAMVTTQLNEAHAFAAAEFPFTDADGDNLQLVRLLSLPDVGTLELDGEPVTNGQVIPEAQLGLLVFTPEQDQFGNPYTSFDFRVSDGDLFNPVTQTMTIEVLETNSVRDQLLNANITLAPNPATDLLRVEATLADQQQADAQLRILALTGQVLQQVPVGLFNGSIHTELSVMDLSPGMYLLELNVDGRIRTERFVKQ